MAACEAVAGVRGLEDHMIQAPRWRDFPGEKDYE